MLQPWLAGMASLLICAATASAQTPAGAGGSGKAVSFGVVGGLTVASMSLPVNLIPAEFDPGIPGVTFSTGSRTGFVGGIFMAFPARGRFGGETGLFFTSKGAGLDVDIAGVGTASGALRLMYLDVPFLARIEAARFTKSTLYILAGPSVGINLTADAHFSALGQSATEPITDFPSTDFGFVGGARLALDRLQFEVRYEHGLKNLAEGDPTVSVKNRTWSALAGLKF